MGKQITKNLKSEYYKLEEFTKSVTAAKLDINNEPPMEVVSNLQYGVEMILDPLRRCFGKPIVINSGYRCKELNKAVGGVPNSWHQKGNAADIKISSQPDAEIQYLKESAISRYSFVRAFKSSSMVARTMGQNKITKTTFQL